MREGGGKEVGREEGGGGRGMRRWEGEEAGGGRGRNGRPRGGRVLLQTVVVDLEDVERQALVPHLLAFSFFFLSFSRRTTWMGGGGVAGCMGAGLTAGLVTVPAADSRSQWQRSDYS